MGSEIPEMRNSGLVLPADVMVMLDPDALTVPVLLELEPTVTLPNEMLDGETLNWPEVVPVPLKDTDTRLVPEELEA